MTHDDGLLCGQGGIAEARCQLATLSAVVLEIPLNQGYLVTREEVVPDFAKFLLAMTMAIYLGPGNGAISCKAVGGDPDNVPVSAMQLSHTTRPTALDMFLVKIWQTCHGEELRTGDLGQRMKPKAVNNDGNTVCN